MINTKFCTLPSQLRVPTYLRRTDGHWAKPTNHLTASFSETKSTNSKRHLADLHVALTSSIGGLVRTKRWGWVSPHLSPFPSLPLSLSLSHTHTHTHTYIFALMSCHCHRLLGKRSRGFAPSLSRTAVQLHTCVSRLVSQPYLRSVVRYHLLSANCKADHMRRASSDMAAGRVE
jgi:hypothetical protein